MTAKTIKAIEEAESRIYGEYHLSARQVRDILTILAATLQAAYADRDEVSEPYYLLRGARSVMHRYIGWKQQEIEEREKASPVFQKLDSAELFART